MQYYEIVSGVCGLSDRDLKSLAGFVDKETERRGLKEKPKGNSEKGMSRLEKRHARLYGKGGR